MIKTSLLALALAIGSLSIPSEPAMPPASDQEEKPSFSIEDFSWLEGHWYGKGMGGTCEEIWSPALGGTMMGLFRLVKDGKVIFYEIMVLGPDEQGTSLRVKHFSESFVAWEDKKDSVRFGLKSVQENRAEFSGLKFKRTGDALEIQVRMRSAAGKLSWVPFNLERRPLGMSAKK